jgi:hypothetical protein
MTTRERDPYAEPYPTGNAWHDYRLGPLCRRIAAHYGIPIDDRPTEDEARRAAGVAGRGGDGARAQSPQEAA